jgi:hypothetical protein
MTAIIETSSFETEVTQLETTDLVLGGVGGPSNRALVQLTNRTKWLYDRIASLTELPVAALPYPTIATVDNRLTVTPIAATAGGKISVSAGTRLTLAEEIVSAATGRLRTFTTVSYMSADLLTSSTYYLRAQVDGSGNLLLYTQRGTDSDIIPAGLLGTPDAASGGGFDSTVFDLLSARVVTGAAGTVPTVTSLANRYRLDLEAYFSLEALQALDWATLTGSEASLNWARAPLIAMPNLTGFAGQIILPNGTDPVPGHTLAMVMVRATAGAPSRYTTGTAQYVYADYVGDAGRIALSWIVCA